jgi:hypothetical protein
MRAHVLYQVYAQKTVSDITYPVGSAQCGAGETGRAKAAWHRRDAAIVAKGGGAAYSCINIQLYTKW